MAHKSTAHGPWGPWTRVAGLPVPIAKVAPMARFYLLICEDLHIPGSPRPPSPSRSPSHLIMIGRSVDLLDV
jgi:hypothetical protein